MADEREPTAAEKAWQERRAESTRKYLERKAAREDRRAENTGDEDRAADARRAAEMYRLRINAPEEAPKGGGNAAVPAQLAAAPAQALAAEVVALRNETNQLRGETQRLAAELQAQKNRQPYRFNFQDPGGGGGGGKDYVAGDDTNIVFTPDGDSIRVDVYYL